MRFSLIDFWKWESLLGFMIFAIDLDREDHMVFALLGFSYCREDKILEIDFLWKCFEFNFNKTQQS